MNQLPRKNSGFVKTILEDPFLTTHEMAVEIRRYDQEMLSREYDRNKPPGMSVSEIEDVLKGLGYAE